CWQKFLRSILVEIGAEVHKKDECLYIFQDKENFLFLGTHVDDLFCLYTPGGIHIRNKIIDSLKKKMTVEEKGEMSFALDTRIQRDTNLGLLKISQIEYTKNLLKKYNIKETRDTPSPLREITEEDLPKTDEEKKEAE